VRCRGARWHGGVRVDSRITDGAVNAPDVDEESDLEEPYRCACFADGERGTEALPRWARLVPRQTQRLYSYIKYVKTNSENRSADTTTLLN